MKLILKVLLGLLFVLYPLAVYYGLNYFEPKVLALLLAVMLFLRYVSVIKLDKVGLDKTKKKQAGIIALIGLCVVAFTMLSNTIIGLKFYPVIISFTFLFIFSYSLFHPPNVIERIARLSEPDLNESGVEYTRLVTKVWCVFFTLNGLISLYTSFFLSFEIWTLYNGFISYLLMGGLFASEFLYRQFFLVKK